MSEKPSKPETMAPQRQVQDQQFQDKVDGEGDYQPSGSDARPETDQQAKDLEEAEKAGLQRAKK